MVQVHGMNRGIEEDTGIRASYFARKETKAILETFSTAAHEMWRSYHKTQTVINERINEEYRISERRGSDEKLERLREQIQLAAVSATSLFMSDRAQMVHLHLNSAV